jgi:hypothetical protein
MAQTRSAGTTNESSLCFDSCYEPEGDPEGFRVLDFLRFRAGAATTGVEIHKFPDSRSKRSLDEFVDWTETFMVTRRPAMAA